jgi:hypothetical protein
LARQSSGCVRRSITVSFSHFHHGLLAADDAKWRAFVEFYAQVVDGCPLKCTDSGLPYVDEVIIKFLDLRGINRDELSIAVQWSWVNKKTGHESRTHAFF